MAQDIVFSRERHLGLVNLNRPKALNSLNLIMVEALLQQLQQWQADESIHAVIVQAEGGKAFCAGGDIRHMHAAEFSEQMHFFAQEYRLNHYIQQYPKPYIALMNGITMGGGVGISLHGSHPIASENFLFAMPETGIGFFPDIGASHLLTRCPGQTGLFLGLTGEGLSAEDAYSLGLIKGVIPAEKFPAFVAALLEVDLSQNPHRRVDNCLQSLAMPIAHAAIEKQQATINECFAGESMEEIISSLQNKNSSWAKTTLKTLTQKAPLSLKVTLAQLCRAKSLPMAECVKMDYCLVSHFMRANDFYEGVRALLIDKDKSPHWQPESLALVSEGKVADYFICDQGELSLIVTS